MIDLFVLTFIMIIFVVLVTWQVITITKFKSFSAKRDKYYIERIDGLEAIIRTEFKSILETLKS